MDTSQPWSGMSKLCLTLENITYCLLPPAIAIFHVVITQQLFLYTVDHPDTEYVTLGYITVRTSLHEKYVGNFIIDYIYDRNVKEHVCRFIGKTNAILCDFG